MNNQSINQSKYIINNTYVIKSKTLSSNCNLAKLKLLLLFACCKLRVQNVCRFKGRCQSTKL